MTFTKQAEKHEDFAVLKAEIDQLREICTKMYCLEHNLDYDRAFDYSKASLAVSVYQQPFTKDKALLIENQLFSCGCETSEYALDDAWNGLIKEANDYSDKIKSAMKRACEWAKEDLETLREYDCPVTPEALSSRINTLLTNWEAEDCECKVAESRHRTGAVAEKEGDCEETAIKIMEWASLKGFNGEMLGSSHDNQNSLYSNHSESVDGNGCDEYDVHITANKIASLYSVIGELETHCYSWRNLGKKVLRAGKEIVRRGKERAEQFIDERKRAAILRDEEAIRSAMSNVRRIIRDLRTGEYKKSRWYEAPAATCPNPWRDTSVTLLNPIKFFEYCKPVRDCLLYHEYQHHHQYEMWRRRNPKAPVGRYLNEIVPNEIQAYQSTLLCLDAKLKEIELMRRKGEI